MKKQLLPFLLLTFIFISCNEEPSIDDIKKAEETIFNRYSSYEQKTIKVEATRQLIPLEEDGIYPYLQARVKLIEATIEEFEKLSNNPSEDGTFRYGEEGFYSKTQMELCNDESKGKYIELYSSEHFGYRYFKSKEEVLQAIEEEKNDLSILNNYLNNILPVKFTEKTFVVKTKGGVCMSFSCDHKYILNDNYDYIYEFIYNSGRASHSGSTVYKLYY